MPLAPVPLPADIVEKARAIVAGGKSVTAAARLLDVSAYKLKAALVPGFREATSLKVKHRRRKRVGVHFGAGAGHVEDRVPEDDAAARLAEVPADTRTLTARLMGDPLPGRRAIDLRARAAAGASIPIVSDSSRADDKTGAVSRTAPLRSPQSQVVEDGIHHLADRHPVQVALVIHADRMSQG